jgi:RNA polymerase sigma factor (sigma-70 family)
MATAQLGAVLRHIRGLTTSQGNSEQSDGDLLRAFLGGNDQSAFEALLLRHGPMVLRVCRRALGDAHDAEDVFQATFLALAQQAASVRKRESLASWLHGVAYRMATQAKRASARRHKHESRVNPTPPGDPALSAAWQELQALLDEEIAGLPETLRGPFVTCCLENKGCAEAAQQLGLQEGTVRMRLTRARKQLQERLKRRGVSLATVLAATTVGTTDALAALPRSLVGATVKAAALISAGRALAGGPVSAQVVTLVEGANQAMFLSKTMTATLLLLCLAIVGAGLGWAGLHRAGAESLPPAREASEETARKGPEKERLQPPDAPARAAARDLEVHGRVLDPEGKPFAGAKLYLSSPKPGKAPLPVRATSGSDGRFEFTAGAAELAPDSTEERRGSQIMAVARDHGCDWAAVGSAGEELTLRLVKDVPIRGRILDPDGRPVTGARLTVEFLGAPRGDDLGEYLKERRKGFGLMYAKVWNGSLPGSPAVLTTGADGRFTLTGAGRERIVFFRIEGPGIASSSLDVMTRVADTVTGPDGQKVYGASFEYVALASRPIRGVVRDKETGKPLAGVSVEHYHGQGPRALTDKEGRYELLGLVKTEHYSLTVKPADGTWFRLPVRLRDTPGLGPLTCDIELTRGLTVRGRVTDKASGKPIAGARVEYNPLAGNTYANRLADVAKPCAQATTDPDGSYTLTVMPGQGVIGVTAPRWEAFRPAMVTPRELKDFFKVPLIEQRGEAYLTVAGGTNSFGAISQNLFNALVLLEPGEKEEGLVRNVALEPPLERKGRVFDPDDQPLAGVTVYGLARHGIETLKGAEFTVRGINPRANRPLVFYHKEKKLGFYVKELRGSSTELLTVKLQPCGSVSGRIVDPDGQPIAELRLVVQGRALPILGEAGGGSQLVTTDKDGRFRAEGLVPGQEYRVSEARVRDGRLRIYAPVKVEPGKHQDLGDVKADLDR